VDRGRLRVWPVVAVTTLAAAVVVALLTAAAVSPTYRPLMNTAATLAPSPIAKPAPTRDSQGNNPCPAGSTYTHDAAAATFDCQFDDTSAAIQPVGTVVISDNQLVVLTILQYNLAGSDALGITTSYVFYSVADPTKAGRTVRISCGAWDESYPQTGELFIGGFSLTGIYAKAPYCPSPLLYHLTVTSP